MKLSRAFRFLVGTAVGAGVVLALLSVVTADVDPATVEATLAPGESLDITKTVDVPEAPPKADVYFLADTTGSMGAVLSAVKADAATVLSGIAALVSDVQFGVGQYKDFPYDAFAFSNDAPIGPDDGVGGSPDASDAINALSASGGYDGSEGQLFALDRIADAGDPTGISWRADASRIVVWFGDAPAHDPVCAAISGLRSDITEVSATAKLVSGGITVVAISTTTGYLAGLDDDPTLSASDYSASCTIDGSSGQATRMASATGGVHLTGVAASEIVDAILTGIEQITFDITGNPVGCDPLEISFDPPVHEDIEGGGTVEFEEQIEVPEDVTNGDLPEDGTIDCTVEFRAGDAVIGVQNISIEVPVEEPTVTPSRRRASATPTSTETALPTETAPAEPTATPAPPRPPRPPPAPIETAVPVATVGAGMLPPRTGSGGYLGDGAADGPPVAWLALAGAVAAAAGLGLHAVRRRP